MTRSIAWVLLALACSLARAEGLPYWVCVDASGAPLVQDKPCPGAPDAPPAGTLSPNEGQGGETLGSDAAPATDLLSWPYWRHQAEGLIEAGQSLVQRARGSDQFQRFIHDAWVWIGFFSFLLLFLLFWLIRGIWRAIYEWRDLRRARRALEGSPTQASPLPKKPAQESLVGASGAEKSEPALEKTEKPAGLVPDRFSVEMLGKLSREQFSELCLRLWRMQGLRAAYDPGNRLSDYPTILMQRPSAPKKPYGVCLCIPKSKEGLGAGAVNELLSVMKERHCTYGSIMTPGEFTLEARDRARGKSVELKGSITLMIEIEGLADRQRRALLDHVMLGMDPPKAAPRPDTRIRLEPGL